MDFDIFVDDIVAYTSSANNGIVFAYISSKDNIYDLDNVKEAIDIKVISSTAREPYPTLFLERVRDIKIIKTNIDDEAQAYVPRKKV